MEKSSYKLLNIILIESQFKREPQITLEAKDFNNKISINVEHQITDNNLFVTVSLNFDAGILDTKQIVALIKMLGIFEYIEDDVLPVKDFAKINAPAIIFPFIREHLASTSMKAGISPILLPPINFIKISQDA